MGKFKFGLHIKRHQMAFSDKYLTTRIKLCWMKHVKRGNKITFQVARYTLWKEEIPVFYFVVIKEKTLKNR